VTKDQDQPAVPRRATRRTDAIDWAPIRADYSARKMTEAALCARHGITPTQLRYRKEKDGWVRDLPRHGERRALISRMFAALDRQVAQLEERMKDDAQGEVALLATMARTLEKLMALDAREKASTPGPAADKDMAELRRQLARRIAQLSG